MLGLTGVIRVYEGSFDAVSAPTMVVDSDGRLDVSVYQSHCCNEIGLQIIMFVEGKGREQSESRWIQLRAGKKKHGRGIITIDENSAQTIGSS